MQTSSLFHTSAFFMVRAAEDLVTLRQTDLQFWGFFRRLSSASCAALEEI